MVPAVSDRVSRAPPYSGYRPLILGYAYGAITPFGPPFQTVPLPLDSLLAALQPRRRLNAPGLGSSPFARHYSGNHYCFLLLRLLRCFSSAGLPPPRGGCRACARRVAPFGHPRITGHLRLPAAFRSLSRPSSPPEAQASPVRPCSLPRRVARLTPAPTPVYILCSRFGPSPRGLGLFYFIVYFSLATTSKNSLLPVENIGVEPMTPCLQSRCSSQLS